MESVLEVNGLCKTFPGGLFGRDNPVLKNVSFSLPVGKTSGFVGANGHGKTTTIKCIFDFISPDAGTVRLFGQEMTPKVRKKVGFLPERPYYYEFLTAREFLYFHWRLGGGGDRESFMKRSDELLGKVDLQHAADRKLRGFSKGMLQRIGIAQAILLEPELVILDEPMSGLDPDGRLMVKDILQEEKKRGTSIFFSSHLLHDMDELCDHLVVISYGAIRFSGPTEEFRSNWPDLEAAFRDMRRREKEGLW
ncbi:MAG: ABC transporter ATP-binding protein [Bdellovibrionaceae bacterium]|nr:ABC transporter ATP-binding protein [Pseudobdellovibrionaceae bacterium]